VIKWYCLFMIVYNYDADLEVSDTCVRSSLLSWIGMSMVVRHFFDIFRLIGKVKFGVDLWSWQWHLSTLLQSAVCTVLLDHLLVIPPWLCLNYFQFSISTSGNPVPISTTKIHSFRVSAFCKVWWLGPFRAVYMDISSFFKHFYSNPTFKLAAKLACFTVLLLWCFEFWLQNFIAVKSAAFGSKQWKVSGNVHDCSVWRHWKRCGCLSRFEFVYLLYYINISVRNWRKKFVKVFCCLCTVGDYRFGNISCIAVVLFHENENVLTWNTRNSARVKFLGKSTVAHTRLPSVGFRSWSRFLAVSLQVTSVIYPAVGCHYFPPGPQLPSQ